MTDRQRDPDQETDSPPASVDSPDAPLDVMRNSPSDRRAFLRQLSGDAVVTAGRLAGFSSIIRRSVVAAGEAATRDLATPSEEEPPTGSTPGPHVPDEIAEPSAPPPVPDPVLALTPEQHDFLADGARATLAVNDPTGAPYAASSIYHWDGAMVRLPAQMFTARAMHVDRDPRVSLLVEDATSEAWVALTGIATVVYGDGVEGEMLLLLAKYFTEDAAVRRWEEMRSSGDRIVIQVRPTRFVWRPA